MIPTNLFNGSIMAAVAADTALLAAAGADAPKMILLTGNFTPGRNLTIDDVVQPTFTGYTPISVTPGAQQVVNNPTNQMPGILLKEPAGGFKFLCTAFTDPEQVITGYGLMTGDGATLIAAQRFDTPVTIKYSGDFVEVSAILGFLANPPIV